MSLFQFIFLSKSKLFKRYKKFNKIFSVACLLATCQAEKKQYKALMLSQLPGNNIIVEQDGMNVNIDVPSAYSDYENLKITETPPVFSYVFLILVL